MRKLLKILGLTLCYFIPTILILNIIILLIYVLIRSYQINNIEYFGLGIAVILLVSILSLILMLTLMPLFFTLIRTFDDYGDYNNIDKSFEQLFKNNMHDATYF